MDFKSVRVFLLIVTVVAAGILVFALTAAQKNRNSIEKEPCPCEPVAVIDITFHTHRDETDNVDSH